MYNNQERSLRRTAKDCSLCRSNMEVWLATLNFDSDREETIRKNISNHCPMCRESAKDGKKRR